MSHFLDQNFCGNYVVIRVYRTLDWPSSMSGTKVMPPKSHFTPKSENCRKSMSLPLAACANSDNSPREHDRELFEPLKDSWNLVVCTAKKTFETWVWGFRWVSSEWGKVLLFFGFSYMTLLPRQWAEIVAQSLVGV